MFGFPSAKRAKQKGGGPIVGQGTGTSDSIDKQAPVGSYIMPADSTAAVGHDGLAKLGLSKKSVPVKVSNGEYEMPPEQVHAVGVQALNQLKAATHQPVAANDQGPRQFFANGGLVEDPEKHKQTSFDITNTPSARPGYDMSPTIRGAQAADDSKMQAKAVAPVVRPGYDAMPAVRSVQAAADRNMQAGAIPAATAPGASSANGAVDSAMQSGSLRNAETAQRGLLGEAVTTAAGQQAIQTALTPSMPTPGNPERAARMQAQFDQPVTKGGQPTANQPVAAGIPSPKAGGAFVEGLRGAAETGLGIAAYPASAVYDGVRNAAGYLSDGNTDQLTQYRDGAADLIGAGVDRMSDSAAQLRESAGATVRGALGIEKRTQAASTGQPSAGNPYSGEPFDQWAKGPSAMRSTSPATPNTSPVSADAPGEQGNGYRMIGTDAERGLDPGIAVKVGADGVPMFTNDKQAIAGAGGDFVASGFPRAQQSTPAGQMVAPAGSRVLASGTNASTEAQQFAQLGSVRNLNNGIGTFSQAESGDAQLAYDRNERAIAERYKMNDISRRGEIGEGGGRVTVVRDSSRSPTTADIQNARLDGRKAQNEALRSGAQLGFNRDAREDARLDLDRQRLGIDRQKGEIEAQAAQIGLQASQRLNQISTQLANPDLPADLRAQLEQVYAMLTTDAKDRYMTVVGGENEMGAKQASTVFDRLTGAPVGAQPATQGGQGAQFQSGKIYKDPASGARAMFKGTDANGSPIWEELN